MNFPKLAKELLEKRLTPPGEGKLRMVLDTDTYNEVDDQFALVQAMMAPERLEVEAIYAAPFHNGRSEGPADGMEKSYEEILRLLKLLGKNHEGFVFKGSKSYLPAKDKPVESEAARHLVKLAMTENDHPLYVVAIGAITNVASAILMEPEIIKNIVVVWLGGSDASRDSASEFNLRQDVPAAQIIFDSGVPFVRIPCNNVSSHLITTKPELAFYIKGKSALGDYLYDIVDGYGDAYAWSKVIWDISATSWLINPEWVLCKKKASPVLTDDMRWEIDESRHSILEAHSIHRDPVFADVFKRIINCKG
ncbi:MAG: nucleoside hydrolase [Planctomycetes bacterium]|nr:nucleoside hydrolase [Planctomycetota bacterium]